MKKALSFSSAMVLCLGILSFSCAAEQPTATAYRTETPIVLDGDLSEWNLSSPIEINSKSQVIRDVDSWLGETDVSCTVYLMWDEENLYLATDTKEASSFGAVGQLAHDMEDNYKIYISTNPEADPNRTAYETQDFLLYLMMDKQNWYTAFDRSMLEREQLARFTSQGMEENQQVLVGYTPAYTVTENGFIFEAAIPWSNFANDRIEQFLPESGDEINFNFCITDNDYPFPNTQDSVQMSWCGTTEINTNPSLWGRVTFE